jgi:hypothetical protein
MYGAIDPTAAQQRGICGIDDRVDDHARQVALREFDRSVVGKLDSHGIPPFRADSQGS